jgi:hypothetical protein
MAAPSNSLVSAFKLHLEDKKIIIVSTPGNLAGTHERILISVRVFATKREIILPSGLGIFFYLKQWRVDRLTLADRALAGLLQTLPLCKLKSALFTFSRRDNQMPPG